jgi:peptidoglycan/xylan/chitin deacetylase (PgdA/CDA1 family)
MSFREAQGRRRQQARKRRARTWRTRLVALASLLAVAAVVVVAVVGTTSGSGSSSAKHGSSASATNKPASTKSSAQSSQAATAAVPILIYHVINVAPASTSLSPSLYVPADEFTSQMDALKSGGWHAVTLDQLEAHWTHGTSLGSGKPIVISFDGGYASQYTTALPVLKRLGWVGVLNVELDGLSPSDGGLNEDQVHALVSAGWELDTQGIGATDLTTLSPAAAHSEVEEARQTLRSRYGVPGNWFSYPLGHYDPTVIAAVQAAGFVGATTVLPGWASPGQDRFRLPRLQVLGGTSSSQLLSQIDSAKSSAPPPASYTGSSTT